MFFSAFRPSSSPPSTSKYFSTPEKTFEQHFTHLQKVLITSVIMNVHRSFQRGFFLLQTFTSPIYIITLENKSFFFLFFILFLFSHPLHRTSRGLLLWQKIDIFAHSLANVRRFSLLKLLVHHSLSIHFKILQCLYTSIHLTRKNSAVRCRKQS